MKQIFKRKCPVCDKIFESYLKRMRKGRSMPSSLRGYKMVTCSKKCSARYDIIKKYILQIERRRNEQRNS